MPSRGMALAWISTMIALEGLVDCGAKVFQPFRIDAAAIILNEDVHMLVVPRENGNINFAALQAGAEAMHNGIFHDRLQEHCRHDHSFAAGIAVDKCCNAIAKADGLYINILVEQLELFR